MRIIIAMKKDDEGFWLVACPKDKKDVPMYQCAGSFIKGKQICDHVRMVSFGGDQSQVQCLYPEKTQFREET